MEMASLLNIVTFMPVVGAIVLMMLPRNENQLIKSWAFLVTLVTFIASIPLFWYFDGNSAEIQFATVASWIPFIGASYHIGVDGISILLYLLTTFIMPLAILASWNSITERLKEYMIAMLILESAMLGVFISLDLLLFYVFWEAMLIPMYLLIGIWGGKRRIYAALKFVIYTMVGSVLMLVAILYLYFLNHNYTGGYTFDLLAMYNLNIPFGVQIWLFLAFALAFAIKVPMFPFHTWLPDAHVEAPTAGSVILAGVLLKMGTYGFLRFNLPLFPNAWEYFTPMFLYLGIIGILYGAWVAMVQTDVKKLVAYSSVSHLGFIVLGMFAMTVTSMQGGILQMINHGVSSGALFLAVGMIYERRHTREISEFGGVTRAMPVFSVFFMIICLSSLGLPGTNGFVGEFLILVGSYQSVPVFTIIATVGIIFAAAYLLWMFRRVMFGPLTEKNRSLTDLDGREITIMIPIIVMIFWIGIYPSTFTQKTEKTVVALLEKAKAAQVAYQMEQQREFPVEAQVITDSK
ncbi:MAG: NADH-quinone oxidoreductase subunit M [Calditrichaeota bacterium]|nr:NADH-quinone oxidoreductase subunit M [Calditrichota bacterium]MCB0302764.1 NADH-quinone oxidoreductase subunit M [Calditrichota bacterium]MCB9090390.1 NADH-quinone oxidoreductase subunit M [Calditrichia bacterium]